MRVSAAAVVLALFSANASSEAPKKTVPQDKVVCATEAATGSHIRKRICVTKEEEERRRKEDQEAMRKVRMSSNRAAANKDP